MYNGVTETWRWFYVGEKKEAFALLEQMPEDKVDFVIEFIRQLEIETKCKEEVSPKMQAFQRLEELRKQTIPNIDLDYDKELAEAGEEKYGHFYMENSALKAYDQVVEDFSGVAAEAGFETEEQMQEYMKEIRKEVRGY